MSAVCLPPGRNVLTYFGICSYTVKIGEKPVLLTARMIDAGAPILGQEYRDTLRPVGFESAPPFTSFVELGH